jgi:hypothetical protein
LNNKKINNHEKNSIYQLTEGIDLVVAEGYDKFLARESDESTPLSISELNELVDSEVEVLVDEVSPSSEVNQELDKIKYVPRIINNLIIIK